MSNSELVEFLRDTEYALSTAGFRFRGYAADRRARSERRTAQRGGERRSQVPA